jgi:opacity protein-like surface antigen
MKSIPLALLAFCLATSPLLAGIDFKTTAPARDEPAVESKMPIPFEFDAEFAYLGSSDVARGYRELNDFDEIYSLVRFVYTPRIRIGILRLGGAYERFGFDFPAGAQVPDTLQAVSAVIGLDTQLSDSILLRFEASPGLYGTGDQLDGDTFNVPFLLGGTYIFSPDIQYVFGVSVDIDRKYPVIPGGGVRWHFASQWTLNAVLPTPRLEYEVNNNLMIFAGANLKGATFRTSDRFGDGSGDTRLNHAVLTYTEVRTGLGLKWKLSPEVSLSLEGGYMPYREFDYSRTEVRYHHEGGAPYGAISLNAAF